MAKVQEFWDGFVAQLPVFAVALLVVLIFAFASMLLSRWHRPAKWTRVNPLV